MDNSFSDENDEECSGFWTAMYDYQAKDEDELSLTTGQIVYVLTKDRNISGDEGWWCGQIGDKVSLFFNLEKKTDKLLDLSKFVNISVNLRACSITNIKNI